MKYYQSRLLKLATKFGVKYAQSQTLKEILENAASYGEKSANGIMNFPAQLKHDQADLRFSVVVSKGMMGGYNIVVSEPSVDPAQYAGNYARLAGQVKSYLEKHINSFPQIGEGTTVLEWSGKDAGSGIASQ